MYCIDLVNFGQGFVIFLVSLVVSEILTDKQTKNLYNGI